MISRVFDTVVLNLSALLSAQCTVTMSHSVSSPPDLPFAVAMAAWLCMLNTYFVSASFGECLCSNFIIMKYHLDMT